MGSQVWSMEKLENKLVDMRDMYEEHKDPHSFQRLPSIKVYIFILQIFYFSRYTITFYRMKYQGKRKILFMNPRKTIILSALPIFFWKYYSMTYD